MNKMADRMSYMAKVQTRTEAGIYVTQNGLDAAHNYLYLQASNKDTPYHNIDHMLTVVKWCGRIAGMLTTETLTSRKGLILGALLHDMNHSGGSEPDTVNVARAVEAVRVFSASHKNSLSDVDVQVAIGCVECTVFPFVVEPRTIEEEIIRDADVLQSIDIDFAKILGEDLRSEISVSRGKNITRKQFAEGELQFLDTIKMYTGPGQLMLATSKPMIVQHFEKLANVK